MNLRSFRYFPSEFFLVFGFQNVSGNPSKVITFHGFQNEKYVADIKIES